MKTLKPITVNKLNQGTLFHMTDSETSPLWVRGEYNRFAKKYECHKYEDVNHEKLPWPKTSYLHRL